MEGPESGTYVDVACLRITAHVFQTILRIVPGIALYFGFVTTAKQFVPESTMYQNFLIGFASRTSVALILQPTTVLKARLEV